MSDALNLLQVCSKSLNLLSGQVTVKKLFGKSTFDVTLGEADANRIIKF